MLSGCHRFPLLYCQISKELQFWTAYLLNLGVKRGKGVKVEEANR